MNIDTLLASPLLLACLGALPGCLRAYARASKTNGRARAASDALIGLVFAASLADWLTPAGYPKLAMLIGLLAGMTGARTLDAFFELAPELVRELAMGWIHKQFGRGGVSRMGRTTGWGELDYSQRSSLPPGDTPPSGQVSPGSRFTRPEDDDQ